MWRFPEHLPFQLMIKNVHANQVSSVLLYRWKSLMNSNPFNGLCCRWESTWISFFPTQNQIAHNLEMDLNREKFSRTSSLFHSQGRAGGGGGLGQSSSQTYRYFSFLSWWCFQIFTLRNQCWDDVTWLCACAVFFSLFFLPVYGWPDS